MNKFCSFLGAFVGLAMLSATATSSDAVKESLNGVSHKIVHESYVDGNWELVLMNADGSRAKNLTNTSDQNELYPQVSPNGKQVAFVADAGEGRDTVRSAWLMDIDGSHRKQIADRGRQPCWSPDGKTVAYLPQEYPKWNVVDYYTKGLEFYDVVTGKRRPHPNDKLHHLYNPSFSADGKWIVSTVHAGMGFDHAIIVFPVDGIEVYNLGIHGCRPCMHPSQSKIAWGEDDHTIVLADLDFEEGKPKIGKELLRVIVSDKERKIYHADWSPDGKFVSVSSGPKGEGDPKKKFTHQSACEIVGVHAKGWDIYAVPVDAGGKVDLLADDDPHANLTANGQSNKESDWVSSDGK
jgi:Tol biopolymer transport system component